VRQHTETRARLVGLSGFRRGALYFVALKRDEVEPLGFLPGFDIESCQFGTRTSELRIESADTLGVIGSSGEKIDQGKLPRAVEQGLLFVLAVDIDE
jgi:hypothetical protein